MNPERTATLVRAWVRLYTLGLPVDIRQGRRDEIDDDLWCQAEDAAASGRTDGSLAGEIRTRLMLGIPADLSWRLSQLVIHASGKAPERRLEMKAPGRGLLAILGGIAWLVWPIPAAYVGRVWPSEGALAWVLMISVVFGTWALAGATAGLAVAAPDRARPGVVTLGLLGALIGGVSVLGAYAGIVALPIASAAVVWELGRIGALSAWQARGHVAAAGLAVALLVVFLVDGNLIDDRTLAMSFFVALAFPYAISWIAIGVSLNRRSSMAHATSGRASA